MLMHIGRNSLTLASIAGEHYIVWALILKCSKLKDLASQVFQRAFIDTLFL